MEIKEYLDRYRKAIKDIERKQRLLKELKQDAISLHGVDYSKSRVSKTRNTEADYVHRLEQVDSLEIAIKRDIVKAEEIREEITSFFNTNLDPMTAFIMGLRYIDGYTWDKIALISNYSEVTVRRKHRAGLEVCEKVIDNLK